jgi:hypothetical protein
VPRIVDSTIYVNGLRNVPYPMGGMYRRCRDQGGFMEGLLDKEGKSEAKYRRYNYGAALFRQATGELGQ